MGKTAVAEGIAQVLASAIADDNQPEKSKFNLPIMNPFRKRDGDKEDKMWPVRRRRRSIWLPA